MGKINSRAKGARERENTNDNQLTFFERRLWKSSGKTS